MHNRIRNGVIAGVAATMAVLPAVPAAASEAAPDCRIYGPAYVAEAVDCAQYLIIILIGGTD